MNDKMLYKAVEIAKDLWQKNDDACRCFVVTAAFYKGKLLFIERNKSKSHTFNIKNPLATREGHMTKERTCAEARTVIRIKNKSNINFRKIELVNVRIDKNGKIKNSRPCNSCQKFLSYFEFKVIHYSNNQGGFEKY